MAQIEYYDIKPVDPFEINAIVRGIVDGVVGQVLAGQGSTAIQFLMLRWQKRGRKCRFQ
jgi:hypothetical protein